MFKNHLTTEDSEPSKDLSLRFSKLRGGKYMVELVLRSADGTERTQKIVDNRVLAIATEEAVDALLGLQIELGRGRLKLDERKVTL